MKKYVYSFKEGRGDMKDLLGGKGAGLANMTSVGLPVPPGFTITTEACGRYYDDNQTIASEIIDQIKAKLAELEITAQKEFGNPENPLLVSIRSGAKISMPGMMDTVLNLGINDDVAQGLIKKSNNPRFVYDSYRRFIQMYADVVEELDKNEFERILENQKLKNNCHSDTDLTTENLQEIVRLYKAKYLKLKKEPFPQDPMVQLFAAVKAVFRSWNNARAIYYRKMNNIPHDIGTAVNVQMMAFGNMGDNCGTGVAFSRNPANGDNHIFGEFLINAQGEDVVAGIRTPLNINELEKIMPDVYKKFCDTAKKLENHYKNMQDMEFTIENGKLYMLQTRNGKRTAQAALKIACDMYDEGLITKEEALLLVEPEQLDSLLHPTFDPQVLSTLKADSSGLPASPGAACGMIAFTAQRAVELSKQGNKVVLVRTETSPEDIEGMDHAVGILTARGGMTSHAAVVARGMGKCCVAGCDDIIIDENKNIMYLHNILIHEGDFISIDGTTGKIYIGQVPTVKATISGYFSRIIKWADEVRALKIRTNADSPKDAKVAIEFGAEGIGLCRTEHMFFESSRIKAVREMILAKNKEQRQKALEKILPMQRNDFENIYEVMEERPVTIRYLDPPLHEFLPSDENDIIELSKELNVTVEEVKSTIMQLHEFNPMMGHRGCRLAITYPEIPEMQTKAVIEAAINTLKKHPTWNLVPEIMIPLVGDAKEMKFVKDIVTKVANEIIQNSGIDLKYKVGTMIEIPRAALLADEIAKEAEFFSFGTNDLTQMTFGFSRDDAGKFLESYYNSRIYQNDPFAKLDQNGVGQLIKTASILGRNSNHKLHIGICGEHGGEPSSIEFCHCCGLDYVSCSPYRVPQARLAAAQAQIKHPR